MASSLITPTVFDGKASVVRNKNRNQGRGAVQSITMISYMLYSYSCLPKLPRCIVVRCHIDVVWYGSKANFQPRESLRRNPEMEEVNSSCWTTPQVKFSFPEVHDYSQITNNYYSKKILKPCITMWRPLRSECKVWKSFCFFSLI